MASASSEQPLRFPLGDHVFAYVQTRGGATKIHIRHFVQPNRTKGGALEASVKGVKMDLKMFNRLCKAKKQLTETFKTQVDKFCDLTSHKPRRQRKTLKVDMPPVVEQCRSDLTTSSPERRDVGGGGGGGGDRRDNNNNNITTTTAASPTATCPFPNCCYLAALTPNYPVTPPTTATGGGREVHYSPVVSDDDNAISNAWPQTCIA